MPDFALQLHDFTPIWSPEVHIYIDARHDVMSG